MIVFLMGMPASGKSTVGKALAEALGCSFIDLDTYISETEKKNIPEIFKQNGEEYFRNAETRCLEALIKQQRKAIVALGGGTPCYNNNMGIMQKAGKTVYLKNTIQGLIEHLQKDTSARPLFSNVPLKKLPKKLEKMLQVREPFYKDAKYSINTYQKDISAIKDEIVGFLKEI